LQVITPRIPHIRTPALALAGLATLLLPCGRQCYADLADLADLGERGLSGRASYALPRGGRRGGVVLRLDGGMGAALLGRLIVQATELECVDYRDGDPLNLTRDNLIKRPLHRRVVVDAQRARARAGLASLPA
jgi:hypothetical protein